MPTSKSSSELQRFNEAHKLIRFLTTRSNRDKLSDAKFETATSLIERWRWNSNKYSGDEFVEIADQAQRLVNEIKAK
ncbi:MAG: hypothetical protein OXG05_10615 [Gammaproteobacteria bacterium]|nr:hypothetical protein [Gammaproteobacteria bacterium]